MTANWQAFESAIEREQDPGRLSALIERDARRRLTPDTLLPVLTKLASQFPDSVGVQVSLAYGLYFSGDDNAAIELALRLKRSAPHDLDVLRAELFFSFHDDSRDRKALCGEILDIDPSDRFALKVAHHLSEGHPAETLDLDGIYERALQEIREHLQ